MNLDKWVTYTKYLYKTVVIKSDKTRKKFLVYDIDNQGMCVLKEIGVNKIHNERHHINDELQIVY